MRNFLAIAALHEASMLAVSLLLAVVNGLRCKLARAYGVLSLIYVLLKQTFRSWKPVAFRNNPKGW